MAMEYFDDLDKQLITCQEEIDKTNFQLSDLKQELEDKKGQCLEAEKLIQDKEKEIEDYIIQRHEMKRKFQEAQETNEKRISELEDDLKSKQNELMDYKDRLQETEKYLEKAQALIEEVKSSKVTKTREPVKHVAALPNSVRMIIIGPTGSDMLLVEKTDIENQLTEVKIQKEELLIQQDENCIKLVEMSNENMELKSHLAGSNEKIAIVERDLNILNSHFSAKCEEVKGLVEKLMQITEEFEKER
ncbi:hypothetical protein ACJMK2_028783 [Sinanodonta woodiana]|uniref:Uncharacterized protein n=1 Tax=Sinanodonta woodiana TaxID=1069815 RepID=A0ABD3X854_SINWO